MLKVKTYLDLSMINGIGLFADQLIHKGDKVWQWDLGLDLILYLPKTEPKKSFVEKYGYKQGMHWYLCCDNARFMNHSYKPNINCLDGYDIAIKTIHKGEEITCDYSQFCEDFKGF